MAEEKSGPRPIEVIGLIVAIISAIAAVIALVPRDTPPINPVVVALQDLDIRSGPDPSFAAIGVLTAGSALDVLGITADRLWYWVLLRDGRRGWVLSASTASRLDGNRDVIQVVAPTPEAPSPTNPPVLANGQYLCAATVNPNATATVLDVVKQFPNATSGQGRGTLSRGESLTVIERSAGSEVYYQVQRSGQTLGWVAAEHLVLATDCP